MFSFDCALVFYLELNPLRSAACHAARGKGLGVVSFAVVGALPFANIGALQK